MKLKLLALVCGLAMTAGAQAFSLGGFAGPIKIKFANYENIDSAAGGPCGLPSVGCINYGILGITTITDNSNNVLWTSGTGGEYISGLFNGITISTSSGSTVNSTGGVVKMFLNTTPLAPTLGTGGYVGPIGGLTYTSVNFGAGTTAVPFLDLVMVPGCGPGPAMVETVCGNFTTLTTPFTGSVTASYLNVIGGTHAMMFDTNAFTTSAGLNADMFSQNTFCPNGAITCGNPIGDWQLLSDDPIRGVVQLPEPASLALVGLALFGMGALARRRKV